MSARASSKSTDARDVGARETLPWLLCTRGVDAFALTDALFSQGIQNIKSGLDNFGGPYWGWKPYGCYHSIRVLDWTITGRFNTTTVLPSPIPDGWKYVLYLLGRSSDNGTSFDLARRPDDELEERHAMLRRPGVEDADDPNHHVTLEYVLTTWRSPGLPVAELRDSNPGLVLLCDFENSAVWKETLVDWSRDPAKRPPSLGTIDDWNRLDVTIVGRRDSWCSSELAMARVHHGRLAE